MNNRQGEMMKDIRNITEQAELKMLNDSLLTNTQLKKQLLFLLKEQIATDDVDFTLDGWVLINEIPLKIKVVSIIKGFILKIEITPTKKEVYDDSLLKHKVLLNLSNDVDKELLDIIKQLVSSDGTAPISVSKLVFDTINIEKEKIEEKSLSYEVKSNYVLKSFTLYDELNDKLCELNLKINRVFNYINSLITRDQHIRLSERYSIDVLIDNNMLEFIQKPYVDQLLKRRYGDLHYTIVLINANTPYTTEPNNIIKITPFREENYYITRLNKFSEKSLFSNMTAVLEK